MGTQLQLDVPRAMITEVSWSVSRHSADIVQPTGNAGAAFQWPTSKIWTLQPVNLVADFSATNNWEGFKYDLFSETSASSDWWVTVNENTALACDQFWSAKVSSTNYPTGWPGTAILNGVVPVGGNAIKTAQGQTVTSVFAIQSNDPEPINQGYCLRFWLEGRPTYQRGGFMQLFFGEFCLSLNGDGVADLYQTPDGTNYAFIFRWNWTDPHQTHQLHHQIVIFPHGRNKIEFLSSSFVAAYNSEKLDFNRTWKQAIYTIPGELRPNTDEGGDAGSPDWLITSAGPWGLAFSQEFRPHVQVSRLGFYDGNGTPQDTTANLYDVPQDLGFVPSVPINVTSVYDENGGVFLGDVLPYGDDTGQLVQYVATFQGAGDEIPSPGDPGLPGSTVTPEFYAYDLVKPPVFTMDTRTPITVSPHEQSLTVCDAPDAESMTVTVYNEGAPGSGILDDYVGRGDVPVVLGDPVLGVNHFIGTAYETEYDASYTGSGLPFMWSGKCRGMADDLMRHRWPVRPPNFGQDPSDSGGRAWLWPDVVRKSFEYGGVDPTTVVIEDEDLYSFRLWDRAGGGGPVGGNGNTVGDQHESTPMEAPWIPMPGTPVFEFQDWLLRDMLGWEFYFDRVNVCWTVYKRPDPNNVQDQANYNNFTPVVGFYGDTLTANAETATLGIPTATHEGLKYRAIRPEFSRIEFHAPFFESSAFTQQDYQDILTQLGATGDVASDPGLIKQLRHGVVTLINYNAEPGAALANNVDYIGIRPGTVYLMQCANRDAFVWQARRIFIDKCFGHVEMEFDADWGDPVTTALRKYSLVAVDNTPAYILSINPRWKEDPMRRAHYHASVFRSDTWAPKASSVRPIHRTLHKIAQYTNRGDPIGTRNVTTGHWQSQYDFHQTLHRLPMAASFPVPVQAPGANSFAYLPGFDGPVSS